MAMLGERPPAHASEAMADALDQARLTPEQVEIVKSMVGNSFRPTDLFAAGDPRHSQDMLDRCEKAIEEYKTKGAKVPKATLDELATWQRKNRVARKREELHAARQLEYEGCICLGFGGRYEQKGLSVATPDGRVIGDPTWEGFRDTCPCPIGVAEQARIEERLAELIAEDQQRRVRKLWSDLKLPHGIGETITFGSHPDPEARATLARIKRWYDGAGKPGAILHGPNQRGKTTTGYLLARAAIRDGQGVVAITTVDLMDRLIDTYQHDRSLNANLSDVHPVQTTHSDLIASLQTVGFLLLDDLGVEQLTDHNLRALYQILNARAEAAEHAVRLLTVITTNLSGVEVLERYGNRISSRIKALCEPFKFDGRIVGPLAAPPTDLDDVAF